MGRLFGTDGIRGIAGGVLSQEVACRVGRALGTVLLESCKRPYVTLGTDTRISASMLSAAVGAGLMSVGCDVAYLGVIPTPAVAYLTTYYRANAGVVISASHNSYEYNGIKIFGGDAYKLSDTDEERIERMIFGEEEFAPYAKHRALGREVPCPTAKDDYTEHLIGCTRPDLSDMKIAIDCANGAAAPIARELFESLGAVCYMIGISPDGTNENEDCGSTHTAALCACVKENYADIGLAFDGDADRFIAMDELGCEVDGDYVMAILATDMKRRGELTKNTVVGTVMTNLGLARCLSEHGIGFERAKVGDRYVLEVMRREGYSFGGEQSGHIIFGKHATTGDGMLTALMLLSYMRSCGKPLSALRGIMKKYPQYTVNVPADDEGKKYFHEDDDFYKILKSAEEELEDGRVLVRASGTEPLIRVMTECEDGDVAHRVAERVATELSARLPKKRISE